jgi:hypothetical protein
MDNQLDGSSFEKLKLMQLANNIEGNGLRHLLQSQNVDTNGSFGKLKEEEVLPSVGEIGSTCFPNFNQACNGSSNTAKPDMYKANMGTKDIYESLPQTNLSMTLGAPSGNSSPLPSAVVDERENRKTSSPFLQGPRSRHLLPKPPRSAIAGGLEANAGMVSQMRVARPPAEGRGRNQLLPRYWPRITDQELQQISGEYPSDFIFLLIIYFFTAEPFTECYLYYNIDYSQIQIVNSLTIIY